jgi:enoyl-CoA hydratase/carnithine racemase
LNASLVGGRVRVRLQNTQTGGSRNLTTRCLLRASASQLYSLEISSVQQLVPNKHSAHHRFIGDIASHRTAKLLCTIKSKKMQYPQYKEILVNIKDSIALVTLNRPNKLNSFNGLMSLELIDVFNRLDRDSQVKVIVLTGAGKAFCAGADLSGGGFASGEAKEYEIAEFRDGGGQVSLAIHRCRKVTICAVNGSAVGIGATMQLGATVRIAYSQAKIGFVFSKRGIVPEAASSYFLPHLIGKSQTLALFCTGRVLPASHHLFNGLFFECIDDVDKVLPAAMDLAKEIATETSVVSNALTKAMIWHASDSPEGQHLLDSKAVFYTRSNADAEEGVKSFLQKRPAKFPGRIGDVNRGEYTLPSWYPWWSTIDVTRDDWPSWSEEYLTKLEKVYKSKL